MSTNPEDRLRLTVAERQDASDGVIALRLVDPEGAELPAWTPGAHIDFHVDGGVVRQYSLCSDPGTPEQWRIGVLHVRDGRGGSQRIHETVRAGDTVEVGYPLNNFALIPSPSYLFIAGGIGITPLLPMVRHAAAQGADWRLVYAGRSLESMAFREELAAYGERVRFVPEDTDGRVDFRTELAEVTEGTLIYCCGPEPLLRIVEESSAHWPAGSLHLERFAPKIVAHEPDESFEVHFALSDVVATIPRDKSILQVAEELGLPVVSSCREGTCGTCETYLQSGTPDHRDSILTEAERAENESMFICVSRSAGGSRLVLEI